MSSSRDADSNATRSERGIAPRPSATVPVSGTLVGGPPPIAETPVAPQQHVDGTDDLLGTVVGDRYRLIEKLGAGGMGAVYRGEHLSLKKRVAVKFLHREMSSNQELVARFEREARTAANLDHPNVVAATDFGRLADGTFYLVMEFVEGRSLRKLMQQDGPLPHARVMRLLRQVGAAVTRAHSLGIVHRDLKPENIVVADREGERDVVKVIDFGIARVTKADGPQLTQLGTVFGTPEYMAPEQAMGQPVDAAADQYALGIIAFEMFTGRRPFLADDAIDLLRMHVGAAIPNASQFASLPSAVDPVFARMLAKRPSERFENVQSALTALDQALTGTPTIANAAAIAAPTVVEPGGTFPQPAWTNQTNSATTIDPPSDRNRTIGLGLAVAGVVALVIAIAVATHSRPQSTTATESAAPVADPRPLDQRMFAYQQQPDVSRAMARMMSGDASGAATSLEARARANPTDGLAAYYLGTAYRTARRLGPALTQFGNALRREPALAEDSTLAAAAVEGLSDASAASTAMTLLRGPLSQSHTAARAVADEAINGSSSASRTSALDLAESMQTLLTPLDRARVRLRLARNCDDLRAALGALESMGDGPPRDEANAVREGACEMLRMGARCASCFEDHGRHR